MDINFWWSQGTGQKYFHRRY